MEVKTRVTIPPYQNKKIVKRRILILRNVKLTIPVDKESTFRSLVSDYDLFDDRHRCFAQIYYEWVMGSGNGFQVWYPTDKLSRNGYPIYDEVDKSFPPWLYEHAKDLRNYKPYFYDSYIPTQYKPRKQGDIKDYLTLYPHLDKVANRCVIEGSRWFLADYNVHLYYDELYVGVIHVFNK